VAWSALADGVRVGELCVGELRTPLRAAGPPDAREAVVFLHGNPGSSADWEPLLAAVGRRWRAVAWDAPGFGHAAAPAGFPQTVAAHAEFVGRALDALGIERAHLVAHDFGGPWGLAWAASDPDRFASAVLLGTGALPGYRWHALARLWRTPYAGELLMATATRLGFRLLLRRGNPRGLPRPFVDRMYDDFDRATRRAVLELYRSVPDVAGAGERLAKALRPLDRPALVLWGRHDPFIPPINAERQRAAFPRAEIRVLERSGHWPFVDAPATVTAALTGFLASHATGGGSDRVASLEAAIR
jgi:pimeloyl-ACP methyl ester carboxylesterase